jgi:peptide-methionine (S)-S-oxide reductase
MIVMPLKYLNFLLPLVLIALLFIPSRVQAETQTAILAGGCFWCVESDFDKLEGVLKTTSGYSGGTIDHPTYQNYHDNIPGKEPHVEVVAIEYDDEKLTYAALLNYYFRHIDPTDKDGQFCDRGPAYRPVIYYQDEQERETARKVSTDIETLIDKKVNVEILLATEFWPAEDYHQNYYTKNPVRYKYYRWRCGRDQRVEELFGSATTD